MKIIKDKTFSEERALYRTRNALVENCRFTGEEDGESFLKESENIDVKNCFMDLRYPMWHVNGLRVSACEMTEKCRAALWYDRDVEIENCSIGGVKALRECKNVRLKNVKAVSPEFGWRCENVRVEGGSLDSEYAFFESKNLRAENLSFSGKYSFQYTENVEIVRSEFHTKDAFWHTKNATVADCTLDGEYVGWYSEGLTLVRCRIRGTQPFCYCKRLKLVDCVMEECDLAFEYSDVEAELSGTVRSVKNPLSGTIEADGYGEIILSNSKYPCRAKILARK